MSHLIFSTFTGGCCFPPNNEPTALLSLTWDWWSYTALLIEASRLAACCLSLYRCTERSMAKGSKRSLLRSTPPEYMSAR